MNYQELLHGPLFPSQIVPLVEKASRHQAPVLIQGERGTRKELVAKIIHSMGNWKGGRFHRLDCKMLTEDTLLDELSCILKEGNDAAVPATLFLKNVDFLGQANQFRLLDVIEEEILQDGPGKRASPGLRYLSSACGPLREGVVQGQFSEDLYERLSTVSIQLPPLRDRVREIPAIAQYLLKEATKKMRVRQVEISSQVLGLLQSYWWPGNLRELEEVILRSAIFSEGETLTRKDLFFDTEKGETPFRSFLEGAASRSPSESEGNRYSHEQKSFLWSLFLLELIHRIKNPLVSVKTFTQLLREKFDDAEFREYFYRVVTEDIEKIDFVLNSLLSYIRVNSPLNKTNTVHDILEEILRKHGNEIENKKVKVFKKFEKNLPETTFHDEQLRYVFDSILQYVIPSTPAGGSIRLLTKSVELDKRPSGRSLLERDGRHIEILIVYTGGRKPVEHLETILGMASAQKDGAIELELRLVREIIERNRGVMKFETNESNPRSLISLVLPVERRKVIYYQSTDA